MAQRWSPRERERSPQRSRSHSPPDQRGNFGVSDHRSRGYASSKADFGGRGRGGPRQNRFTDETEKRHGEVWIRDWHSCTSLQNLLSAVTDESPQLGLPALVAAMESIAKYPQAQLRRESRAVETAVHAIESKLLLVTPDYPPYVEILKDIPIQRLSWSYHKLRSYHAGALMSPIIRRALDGGMEEGSARSWGSLLWACAQFNHIEPRLFALAARDLPPLLSGALPVDTANVLHAFALSRYTHGVQPLVDAAIDVVMREWPQMNPTFADWSNLVFALAKLNGYHAGVFSRCASKVVRLQQYTGNGALFSNLVWAFAKTNHTRGIQPLLDLVERELLDRRAMDWCGLQVWSQLLAALSRLRHHVPALFNLGCECALRAMKERNDTFGIVQVLWSLASSQHHDRQVFAHAATALPQLVPSFSAQSLSTILWAYSTTGLTDGADALIQLIVDLILNHNGMQGARLYDWNNALMALNMLKHLCLPGTVRAVFGAAARPMAALMSSAQGKDLADTMWAFCNGAQFDAESTLLLVNAVRAAVRAGRVAAAPPQQQAAAPAPQQQVAPAAGGPATWALLLLAFSKLRMWDPVVFDQGAAYLVQVLSDQTSRADVPPRVWADALMGLALSFHMHDGLEAAIGEHAAFLADRLTPPVSAVNAATAGNRQSTAGQHGAGGQQGTDRRRSSGGGAGGGGGADGTLNGQMAGGGGGFDQGSNSPAGQAQQHQQCASATELCAAAYAVAVLMDGRPECGWSGLLARLLRAAGAMGSKLLPVLGDEEMRLLFQAHMEARDVALRGGGIPPGPLLDALQSFWTKSLEAAAAAAAAAAGAAAGGTRKGGSPAPANQNNALVAEVAAAMQRAKLDGWELELDGCSEDGLLRPSMVLTLPGGVTASQHRQQAQQQQHDAGGTGAAAARQRRQQQQRAAAAGQVRVAVEVDMWPRFVRAPGQEDEMRYSGASHLRAHQLRRRFEAVMHVAFFRWNATSHAEMGQQEEYLLAKLARCLPPELSEAVEEARVRLGVAA